MRAGTLQHRVTIEQKVTGRDPDTGAPITTWETFAERFANVLPVKGREFIAAQAAQAETTVRFVMRYLPGVEATMRVVFRSKTYNITAVLNEGTRDSMLTLVTDGGVNTG